MSYFYAESGLSCFPSSTYPHVKMHSYANDECRERSWFEIVPRLGVVDCLGQNELRVPVCFFFFYWIPNLPGRCLLCSTEADSRDHDGPAYYETIVSPISLCIIGW